MVMNERGTIAMARTNDPHSASAQFFINLKDNNFEILKMKQFRDGVIVYLESFGRYGNCR